MVKLMFFMLQPLRSSTQCPLVVVKQDDSMDVDVDQSEAADLTKREACFMLFSKFTKEVRNDQPEMF